MEVKVASYILCLFVSAFPTQKTHFEESKYKKPVWLGIKCNFLEKVAFWVCEENTQCHKGAQRCIWKKPVLIYIRWTHRAITKLPFNKSEDVLSFHAQIPHSSHLISLLYPLPWNSLSRHPLLLSSSSSTRILLYILLSQLRLMRIKWFGCVWPLSLCVLMG